MRKIEFLSPTSISLFNEDVTEFYVKYLSDNRPPKIPQTGPMSVGSAFDAYVKSYLFEKIFGRKEPKYELKTLFESQVESQNRDAAWEAGKYIFEEYRKSGSLVDLMVDIQAGVSEPRFEFELKGSIDGYKEGVTKRLAGGVMFLGKPDLFYRNKEAASVIHDWKVNGYYSKYNISPMPGFVRLRDGGQNKGAHKDAFCMMKRGVMINTLHKLEDLNEDWAQQLSIYAWLCGEEVGADFFYSVDQVVCKPGSGKPILRFAEHRLRANSDYQFKVFARAQNVWEIVHSDWIFRNLTQEESQKRCALLDQTTADMKAEANSGNSLDAWFSQQSRM